MLLEDPELAALVAGNVGVLTSGYDFQWTAISPTREAFSFSKADAFCDWCLAHGIRSRAQFIIWRDLQPEWLQAISSSREAELALRRHVTAVVTRYRGLVRSWDVVNESVRPDSGRPDGLRPSSWLNLLGPEHIPLAFELAREADPEAELVLNEDRLHVAGEYRRRDRMLELLAQLRRQKTPVDALGVQGHLRPRFDLIDDRQYRDFLKSVADMGYRILITELDAADDHLPADTDLRDGLVADAYEAFLDVTLDELAVQSVSTWSLSDDESWYNWRLPRADGLPVRPLPFDRARRPKAAFAAIARSLAAAPMRSARSLP